MKDKQSFNWFWCLFNLGSILGTWEYFIDFIVTHENSIRNVIKDHAALSITWAKQAKQVRELTDSNRKLQEEIKDLKWSVELLGKRLAQLDKDGTSMKSQSAAIRGCKT